MEDVMRSGTLRLAKKNMLAYLETHDSCYIAEDAIYINTSSGERAVGREAIKKMINFYYHVAFNAYPKITNRIVTGNKAMVEGFFIGKHIGEFAGIQPTNKNVNVPVCIVYDLENGMIKHARVYFTMDVMMKQLTS